MSALLLDGKVPARDILSLLRPRSERIRTRRGHAPKLAVLAAGADQAAQAYLKQKLSACKNAGIETLFRELAGDIPESEALREIEGCALDAGIDAILIESPLPQQLSLARLLDRLPADKDVEGLSPENFGRLFAARGLAAVARSGAFVPATAQAILRLLELSGVKVAGARAAVVGRSNIVGRPVAHLLTCADATVTLCHSKTRDLDAHLREADVVVAAAGRARFIQGSWLKPGCVVLDAGANYEGGCMVGDVDFESASRVAAAITPVPGGVGPLTTAMLVSNVVMAAERRFQE